VGVFFCSPCTRRRGSALVDLPGGHFVTGPLPVLPPGLPTVFPAGVAGKILCCRRAEAAIDVSQRVRSLEGRLSVTYIDVAENKQARRVTPMDPFLRAELECASAIDDAARADRGKRYAGRSQMNIVSLALHGFRSMMVFAEDVLVRVAISCALLAALSTPLLGIAAILKITGHATPGWFTAATGSLILIVMQAGIMPFVTLLLSGFVRNSLPITRAEPEQLIDHVEKTKASSAALQRNVPS
jgi:hypothetical protein